MRQMIFTHVTEHTLRAACVLVNSARVYGDRGRPGGLDAYLPSSVDRPAGPEPAELCGCTGCANGSAGMGDRRRRGAAVDRSTRCGDTHAAPWLTGTPRCGVAPASGIGARPVGPADGRRDGDGPGRPIRGGELRRLKMCAAPTARPRCSTSHATGRRSSATRQQRETVITWRLPGGGGSGR
jgi:hypothetical protein